MGNQFSVSRSVCVFALTPDKHPFENAISPPFSTNISNHNNKTSRFKSPSLRQFVDNEIRGVTDFSGSKCGEPVGTKPQRRRSP